MEQSLLIFLSSVVDGMKDERDAINEVVDSISQKISRCEYYPARRESPIEVCLNEARNCGIFIGIYNKRYGKPPPNDNPTNISVTEMEYQEAKKIPEKPILIFISENKEGRDEELQKFVTNVMNSSRGHYVGIYRNLDHLKYLVLHSLINYIPSIITLNNSEKKSIEELLPAITQYKTFLLNNLEYNTTGGIAKVSTVIQYKMQDLYVATGLKKYESIDVENENKVEQKIRLIFVEETPDPESNWDELQRLTKSKELENSITTGINIMERINEQKPIIIIGDPGSGKSTMLKRICVETINQSSTIPFLIQIRDFSEYVINTGNESVTNYLKTKYKEQNFSEDFFSLPLNAGTSLILFDGLDEVWDVRERARINNILQEFCARWSGTNKIIISSRIKGYLQNPLAGNYDILRIEKFSQEQIKTFICKWMKLLEDAKGEYANYSLGEARSKELFGSINFTPLQKLSENPLLLLIVCAMFSRTNSFPKRKSVLYADLIETLLNTWEAKKGLPLDNLHWRDYLKILENIAFEMFTRNKLQIDQNELFRLIGSSLKEEGLTEFVNKDIQGIVDHLEQRSGILLSYDAVNYSFSHLSLLEYLSAMKISHKEDVKEMYSFLKPKLHDQKNSSVILFLSSLLSDNKSRIEASNFLNLILNSNSNQEEIHLLDLMLVINSLTDGSLVTDEFRNVVFKKIDEVWDEKRDYDHTFNYILSGFLGTPYENDFVNCWRKKCEESTTRYYRNMSSSLIFSKPEYIDDFRNYCYHILHTPKNTDDYYMIKPVIEVLSSNKNILIINIIKDMIEKLAEFPIIFDIAYELAIAASNDPQLKNWYFLTLAETKNSELKYYFIQYSILVDKDLASKSFQLELENKKDGDLKDDLERLELKNKLGRKEFLKKSIRSLNPSDYDDESDIGIIIVRQIEHIQSYDADIINELVVFLKKIPVGHYLLALRVVTSLLYFVERFGDKLGIITKFLNENKEAWWQGASKELLLRLIPPADNDKKDLLNLLKNTQIHPIVRRNCHHMLQTYFGMDRDFVEINTQLIEDKGAGRNALYALCDYPQELEKNFDRLVSMYKIKQEEVETYDPILKAIRTNISMR